MLAGSLLLDLQDRSFTFILKTPPASVLLAKAAGIEKGSGTPNTQKVGKVSQAQLKVTWRGTVAHCGVSRLSSYGYGDPGSLQG